jgi:hypothetical protein
MRSPVSPGVWAPGPRETGHNPSRVSAPAAKAPGRRPLPNSRRLCHSGLSRRSGIGSAEGALKFQPPPTEHSVAVGMAYRLSAPLIRRRPESEKSLGSLSARSLYHGGPSPQRRARAGAGCAEVPRRRPAALPIGPSFRDPKQKNVFRVDADAIPGARLGHPRKLHDRAARRRQDRRLDLLRVPFDPQSLTSGECELSDRHRRPSASQDPKSRRTACAARHHRVDRVARPR